MILMSARHCRWNTRRTCFAVVLALLFCCGVSTAYCQDGFESPRVASKCWVMVAPTYAFPFGDGFEGTDPHLGVRITGGFPWSDKLSFAATFQHQPLEVAAPAEFDVQKYLGGFHYLDDVTRRLTIYGSYDIGGYRHSSATRLGMAGAFGIIYWAATKIGIDLSIRIDQTSLKTTTTSASGYLVEVHAGIRTAL